MKRFQISVLSLIMCVAISGTMIGINLTPRKVVTEYGSATAWGWPRWYKITVPKVNGIMVDDHSEGFRFMIIVWNESRRRMAMNAVVTIIMMAVAVIIGAKAQGFFVKLRRCSKVKQ
jgi:hypothetical protein